MDDIIDAPSFVERFHNLTGVTTASRRKNFGKLLHQYKSLNPNALKEISQNLKPRTNLEELFKLDFLIYFRRSEDLIDILLEGKNDNFVKKISTQWWLFEEYFKEISPELVLNKIIPFVSFSVRMKILKKMSQVMPSEKFQIVFDGILERYGFFIAIKFICGCTVDYIKKAIKLDNIKLNQWQLQKLYNKDSNLIKFYLINTRHSPLPANERSRLLKFLYCRDLDLYKSILVDLSLENVVLGKRTTRKFVKNNRNNIIQNPHKYSFLKRKVVFRKLEEDVFQLYRNMLPSDVGNLASYDDYDENYALVQEFPKKYHYHLYFKVIEDHYKIKFTDHMYLLDSKILRLIKNNAERAFYAKIKVEEGLDQYIKYLEVKDSIPLIKENINFTANDCNRGKLVKCLVETCAINNDPEALLEVMKYFNQRHKNDQISVHLKYIRSIEHFFGFKNFTEEMWQLLNDLLLNHMLKYDKRSSSYQKIQTLPLMSYNIGTTSHQKLSYMEFLFRQGKPIDNFLEDYFRPDSYDLFFKWGTYQKTFEKYFFLFAIHIYSCEAEWEKNINKNREIIDQINNWNCFYKDDSFSLYDFPSLYYTLVETAKQADSFWWIIPEAFREKIFTTVPNQYRQLFLDIYWKKYNFFASGRDLQWFLKFDILTVSKYFGNFVEAILTLNLKSQTMIWYMIKKLDIICDKFINFCLSKITEIEGKEEFVLGLSILLKPPDYVALAESYITCSSNDSNVTKAIAKFFKNCNTCEALPHFFHYCKNIYFKNCVKSLYSLLHKTPENLLNQYLTHLSKSSLSIRKHYLYLTCALSTVSNAEMALLKEKKCVSKRRRFLTTFNYLLKNPNDLLFDMLIRVVFLSKKYNESFLNIMINCFSKIPQKYKIMYLTQMWEYCEIVDIDTSKLILHLDKLLSLITDKDYVDLPLDFGLSVIPKLLITSSYMNWFIIDFAYKFLIHQTNRSAVYDLLFAELDNGSIANRLIFFRNWHQSAMSEDKHIGDLQPFREYFKQQFIPETNFKKYIQLQFLEIKINLFSVSKLDDKIDLLAVSIVNIVDDIDAKYGPLVLPLFASEMEALLSNYFVFDGKNIKWACYYKLVLSKKLEVIMVLIKIIGKAHIDTDEDEEIFLKILKEILKTDDVTVQLYLREYYGYYIEENLKQLN